ncbi:glycosyl transferase family 1 [Phaeobacter sp. 11ANDIMAR09]|nr:glycosyltransferase [Phaeobacter sp. 11ANDIMAR09]KPD11010.1 glycosyl transferase family 1 [Phaeobacter sp. 11ANDIMAR09]
MTGIAPKSNLLIYAPVPLHLFEGALYIERQAVNGLHLWARHFDQVTVMMPVSATAPAAGWVPLIEHQQDLLRVHIEPLPMAYRPDQFLRALPQTLKRIRALISQADYLSFAIGGLFGDWGAVSCLAAHQMQRPYAVWTDRVESEVMRQSQERPRDKALDQTTWRSRLRGKLYHRPMAWLEQVVIERAALGLFHGAETFQAYHGMCRNPQLVHDIHIAEEDHISDQALADKVADVGGNRPLRLIYTGRAEAMKGPIDWTTVLERLNVLGVEFEASWLGAGEALPQMQARIKRAGLSEKVHFAGFVEDHAAVLHALRQADLFLFCHKTPESPRCLIEALTSGTPILGYEGAFARDLISGQGGGVLVPRGDTEALAHEISELNANRSRLAKTIVKARADGLPFSDAQVFAHRAGLIARHLPVGPSQQGKRSQPLLRPGWDAARN